MIRLPIRFVEELARAQSLERVLSVAAAWLPQLVAADRAKITFQDGGSMVARSHRRDGGHDPQDDLQPVLAGSPLARVLASGELLEMDGPAIARDQDPAMRQLYDTGMRQMLFVPMRTGGRTVGVVGLARREDRRFGPRQRQQVTVAANWVANQALLFRQLRASARLAETDPLTGLANRARLMRVLGAPGALHLPDRKGQVVGVLHLDLDHFKDINDRLGHAVGDRILRHAAGVMRDTASSADLVARIGGDEFVIVTRTDPEGRHLSRLAHRLAERLSGPFADGDLRLSCPASIGTALARTEGMSGDRLIANADIALYEVKRRGGGAVCAYAEAMRQAVEARRDLVADLRQAVAERSFEPYFQPVIALADGAVMSCEMLVRWQHPRRGLLGPSAFLQTAKDSGFVSQIDDIVRGRGLALLGALRQKGAVLPQVTFNAAEDTLLDPDLPEALLWQVMEHGLSPADLAVEVAEPVLLGDRGGTVEQNIALLSEMGFAVIIDDYGLGHASMAQIRRLKVRGLKLGRMLTRHLTEPCAEAILRAVLAMAGELGLHVIAKAVESEHDIARLHALQCHQVQGYAVAPPMEGVALPGYLSRRGTQPVPLVG